MRRIRSFGRPLLFPGILCAVTFLAPPAASAHGLKVECRLSDKKVHVYAFYTDRTDAEAAEVKVLDGEKVIASGTTNRVGLWSFPAPSPGKYRVEVDAGAGHSTSQFFTVPHPEAAGPNTTGDDEDGPQISQGPDKEEATRYPWLKIAFGLGIIGLVAGVFVLTRIFRNPTV